MLLFLVRKVVLKSCYHAVIKPLTTTIADPGKMDGAGCIFKIHSFLRLTSKISNCEVPVAELFGCLEEKPLANRREVLVNSTHHLDHLIMGPIEIE